MTEDDFHDVYRRSVSVVVRGAMKRRERSSSTIIAKIFGRLAKNISREPLTGEGSFRYHNALYGDAARGCHHRGDGPDASQRVITNHRQRLGVLSVRLRGATHGVNEPRVRIIGEGGK